MDEDMSMDSEAAFGLEEKPRQHPQMNLNIGDPGRKQLQVSVFYNR